jgi:hypothetical protein
MTQKIHFISYGDNKYDKAKQRIKQEAIDSAWFDTIKIYEFNDLTNQFKEKYEEILKMNRGGGYWIWKYDIIKQSLDNINDNDILVYCDAGCVINKDDNGRFKEYIEMLNKSNYGIISFQMHHIEKKWTTKEIFNYFNITIESNYGNSGQYVGGILIMKKCKHIYDILDIYKKVLENNMYLFTDKYNKEKQINVFKENRHDQSIFSIIRKIYGSIILNDETDKKNIKSPFIAMRKKK